MTMHHELLKAYRQELQFLREIGAEFGKAHPRLGSALALDSSNATDPFVERLLEGIAFLTAKTSMRLDSEQDRLHKDLFSVLMPDLLCALPPASMVEFQPLPTLQHSSSVVLPRGMALRYTDAQQQDLLFRTTMPVELVPLKLEVLPSPEQAQRVQQMQSARLMGNQKDLASCHLFRLKLTGLSKQAVKKCIPDQLKLFFKGSEEGAMLWRGLTHDAEALLLVSSSGQLKNIHPSPLLKPTGFGDEDALLPAECVLPSGLRLLREWVYWPQRFAFAELGRLKEMLEADEEDAIELWWFIKHDPMFPNAWSRDIVKLFCAPAINLMHMQCEPIPLTPTQSEYAIKTNNKIKPARELIAIESVHHLRPGAGWKKLDTLPAGEKDSVSNGTHYSIRKWPRWIHDKATGQIKHQTEWQIAPHLTIQDNHEMLTVNAWTSQQMDKSIRPNDNQRWHLDSVAPVMRISGVDELIDRPKEAESPPLKVVGFRIDQLAQVTADKALAVFKEWLDLSGNTAWSSGIESVSVTLTVRRAPHKGPALHAQGWFFQINLDSATARHPQTAIWQQILTHTLCKQLYSESFLELNFISQDQVFQPCRVWR